MDIYPNNRIRKIVKRTLTSACKYLCIQRPCLVFVGSYMNCAASSSIDTIYMGKYFFQGMVDTEGMSMDNYIRFVTLHELAHVYYGHEAQYKDYINDNEEYKTSPIESEANALANYILTERFINKIHP